MGQFIYGLYRIDNLLADPGEKSLVLTSLRGRLFTITVPSTRPAAFPINTLSSVVLPAPEGPSE